MSYHTKFRHIDRRVRRATTELVRARPARQDPATQLELLDEWLGHAAEVYGVVKPAVRIVSSRRCGGSGVYEADTNTILIPKASVVTLTHEFRHAIQWQRRMPLIYDVAAREDDARAWSLSLVHRAAPRWFARGVRAGRIMYVTPEELG